jgi:pimeloyl-ACP methyl ester carboxylesterase
LIEPVAFHLLRQEGRLAEWEEVSALATAVRAAVLDGDLRRAAAVFMSYWIGHLGWWLMPRRQKERIVPTMTKVTAEFEGIERIRTQLDDYASVRAPTLLVAGGRTRRPTRAIVDILSESLPSSLLRVLPGAGHMSPFTHRDEIRDLIVEHVDAHE